MRIFLTLTVSLGALLASAQTKSEYILGSGDTLRVTSLAENALRVQVLPIGHGQEPASWYLKGNIGRQSRPAQDDKGLSFSFNKKSETLSFLKDGKLLISEAKDTRCVPSFSAQSASPRSGGLRGVSQSFLTPADDYQFGTGQFQDGNLNVKGLTRRLTQVNTQISLPMIISNKGYGILWNNCGMTDFNPADNSVKLEKDGGEGETVTVNTTSTTGNKREERHYQTFSATLNIKKAGKYALLLDVGQSMARRHYLEIDGKVLYEANNLWLPPTAAVFADLTKGEHKIVVRGEKNDQPTVFYRLSEPDKTTFSSPVAQTLDYTIFSGTADEIIATYRKLTGEVPMMPRWAFGYVHCRERYVSQDDVLSNAAEFRQRNIPIDVIVQDWQWWGKYGWNAMRFDEDHYPAPKLMTDSLHKQDIRMMLSVWAKVDKNSTLGKEMEAKGDYIPGTDWIDFFNREAGQDYWNAYRDNILPTGIDAWWQDATEPENDDLAGRLVNKGQLSGDAVRNIFPFAVNDVVYNGLLKDRPNERPMIMTRSASPGIQRFGVLTWSGDVGNDDKTFERQIVGGLGQMACGVPWWTYDAGGFFRPGDQYTNEDYQRRMIRWIQAAVYLPVMRVHGYMSKTEPWRFGRNDSGRANNEIYDAFVEAIRKRYNLFSYIYSEAARVSRNGGTLMRPLVFDFPKDETAMQQTTSYMFGPSILVTPALSNDMAKTKPYLPALTYARTPQHSRWYRLDDIAVVRPGSIIPWNEVNDSTRSTNDVANAETLTIRIFPGADAAFTLYEDDGTTLAYQNNAFSEITFNWNNEQKTLTISARQGKFPEMPTKRTFILTLPDGTTKNVDYTGANKAITF